MMTMARHSRGLTVQNVHTHTFSTFHFLCGSMFASTHFQFQFRINPLSLQQNPRPLTKQLKWNEMQWKRIWKKNKKWMNEWTAHAERKKYEKEMNRFEDNKKTSQAKWTNTKWQRISINPLIFNWNLFNENCTSPSFIVYAQLYANAINHLPIRYFVHDLENALHHKRPEKSKNSASKHTIYAQSCA